MARHSGFFGFRSYIESIFNSFRIYHAPCVNHNRPVALSLDCYMARKWQPVPRWEAGRHRFLHVRDRYRYRNRCEPRNEIFFLRARARGFLCDEWMSAVDRASCDRMNECKLNAVTNHRTVIASFCDVLEPKLILIRAWSCNLPIGSSQISDDCV